MASVQGTVPDQSWATSLPGYFKDNIKPAINDYAFLLPRVNVAIPNIVSKSTVGSVNDRGFIDKAPQRINTNRNFILNPSTYVTRLHPHDLTSGTGGIDNLSNLYRFGQPTPFSNAIDFADVEYWASRELAKERLDPLSNGYAARVIGPNGEMLQMQMREDQQNARLREQYRYEYLKQQAERAEEKYRADNEANAPIDRRNERARRVRAKNLARQRVDDPEEDAPAQKRARESTDEDGLKNDVNGASNGASDDINDDVSMEEEDFEDIEAEGKEEGGKTEERAPEDATSRGGSVPAAAAAASASGTSKSGPIPTAAGEGYLDMLGKLQRDARAKFFKSYDDPSGASNYSNNFFTKYEDRVGRGSFKRPFVDTFAERLAGSSQNKSRGDVLERENDPQYRGFAGEKKLRALFEDPNVNAGAAQINQSIATGNNNLNDGNKQTAQEKVGQGGSDAAPPPTPLAGAATAATVNPTLTGNVFTKKRMTHAERIAKKEGRKK